MRKLYFTYLLFALFAMSACSLHKTSDKDSETIEKIELETDVLSNESYYVKTDKVNGRFVGESENVTVDIENTANYPSQVYVYLYTEQYPSIVTGDDFFNTGHISLLDEYVGRHSWCTFYDVVEEGDNWNPDLEPLFREALI